MWARGISQSVVLSMGSAKCSWGFPQALQGGRALARGWFRLLSSVLMPSREGSPLLQERSLLQALTSMSRPLVGQLLPQGGWDWRQPGALGNPGNHVLPEVTADKLLLPKRGTGCVRPGTREAHFTGCLLRCKSKAKSR